MLSRDVFNMFGIMRETFEPETCKMAIFGLIRDDSIVKAYAVQFGQFG